MGTRHHQTVIDKEGNVKIAQYGQWDGYPSGQGVEILDYLRKSNLDKYYAELIKIPEITEEEGKKIDQEEGVNWEVKYPYLSRDCGSDIHKMIEEGTVKFVQRTSEEEARKWCEGFYTINFKTGKFITEWNGKITEFPLDKLPTEEEYLAETEPNEDED